MRKLLLMLALTSMLAGHTATAQTVALLHEGKPSISVTYPNGWQIRTPPEEGVNLISAMPDDGSLLWQGMWLVRDASTVAQALEILDKLPGRLFSDIQRTGEPAQKRIGSLDVVELRGAGTYNSTDPVKFFIYLFETPGQRIGAMAYMGRPGAIEKHRAGLETLLHSLSSGSE